TCGAAFLELEPVAGVAARFDAAGEGFSALDGGGASVEDAAGEASEAAPEEVFGAHASDGDGISGNEGSGKEGTRAHGDDGNFEAGDGARDFRSIDSADHAIDGCGAVEEFFHGAFG